MKNKTVFFILFNKKSKNQNQIIKLRSPLDNNVVEVDDLVDVGSDERVGSSAVSRFLTTRRLRRFGVVLCDSDALLTSPLVFIGRVVAVVVVDNDVCLLFSLSFGIFKS